MAFTWLLVITFGALAVSILHYKNACNLYRLTHVDGVVEVTRNGQKRSVSQEDLVPGDVLTVVPGISYCDMVLVETTRVLVDESALTGEANPIGKTALDPTISSDLYDEKVHKRNTIFAGTTILEADHSRAIVLKTGSYTTRGGLIRDIFGFRRQTFKFDTEVPVVITILFLYSCIGWGIAYHWTGKVFVYGWFYGIYVIAACLPPLLPTVFTLSVGVSDDRLAKKKITCTNSESILIAGKVTRAFFDKTGTLTKQGLDFISARGKDTWIHSDIAEGDGGGFSEELSMSLSPDELKLGMACCHSLTPNSNGDMIGNPVDRVIFATSKARMDYNPSSSANGGSMKITDATGKTVYLVKHFDFDHHRMTQSVIIRHEDTGMLEAFCKGSGEAIRERCDPATLPNNFDHALRESAKSGLYQISMGSKVLSATSKSDLDVGQFTRDHVESNLTFQGVINFKNVLRDNAAHVIGHLERGEVISTMVTGDNVLTGIRIARESGILKSNMTTLVGELQQGAIVWRNEADRVVDLPEELLMLQESDAKFNALTGTVQLAISGEAWRHWLVSDPKGARRVQDSIRVYGRCNPYDKVSVVQGAAQAGHVTLMSGDGGNDCGALKAAHVGVALSDAEASIGKNMRGPVFISWNKLLANVIVCVPQVAPFTSLNKDIGSIVDVLLEGRCALGSSLASYKFVIVYGQVVVMNQLISAYYNVTFSQWSWIFTDGVWTVLLSTALPLAQAAPQLSPTRPTASILGLATLASTLGVLLINFLFIVIGFAALNHQPWYQCRQWSSSDADLSNITLIGDNYETGLLFIITGFQVISSAIVYNFGYEFRQAWHRNHVLVILLFVFVFLHFYVTLIPGKISCLFRVNCINDDTFDYLFGHFPIQNPFNTTVFPPEFRRRLFLLIVANTTITVLWDYFVVNGTRRYFATKKRRGRANGALGSDHKIGSRTHLSANLGGDTALDLPHHDKSLV
jgi:predicted P-type ATPase